MNQISPINHTHLLAFSPKTQKNSVDTVLTHTDTHTAFRESVLLNLIACGQDEIMGIHKPRKLRPPLLRIGALTAALRPIL